MLTLALFVLMLCYMFSRRRPLPEFQGQFCLRDLRYVLLGVMYTFMLLRIDCAIGTY